MQKIADLQNKREIQCYLCDVCTYVYIYIYVPFDYVFFLTGIADEMQK